MTDPNDIADVCIIGAGLAGGLLAYELAQRGVEVAVLEAGPHHDPSRRFTALERALRGEAAWPGDDRRDAFTNAGSYRYPLNDTRVKAVGGSTLHWNAVALRLHASDFVLRQRFGVGADWPITYEELEPYYVGAEIRLGVAGIDDNPFASPRSAPYPLPGFPFSYGDEFFGRAVARRGIAFHHVPYARNSIPYEGRPACQAFAACSDQRVCPIAAQYTSENHLEAAVRSGHATLVADANVVRLETAGGRAVRAAVWIDRDSRQREQLARVFVLAAHAVESARLLLLSTSGSFPNGLANGSGMVGQNFMEHPTLYVSGVLRQPVFPHRIGFHTMESHQFSSPRDRDDAAAFKIEVVSNGGATPVGVADLSGRWGAALAAEVRESYGRELTLRAMCEQLPEERNAVTLDPDVRDSFGNPAPCLTYGFGGYEEARRGEALAVLTDLLGDLGATRIITSLPGEFGICSHHLGTCRMGRDRRDSVVDRDLRCHDVDNLFVVGSSVFPTGGTANPSLTIAALALRLADHLRPA